MMISIDRIFAVLLTLTVLFSQLVITADLAYFLIWVVVFFIVTHGAASNKSVNKNSIVLLFILIFFVFIQLRPSLLVSLDVSYDVIFFLPAIGVTLAASVFCADSRTSTYLWIVLVSTGVGILNIISHWFFPLSPLLAEPYAGTRWVGGFSGPNELGQFFVLVLALSLGLRLSGKISVNLLTVIILVSTICIFNTFSRGTFFSFAIVIVSYFVVLSKKPKGWRYLVLVIAMLAASYFFLEAYIFSAIDRFEEVRKNSSGRSELVIATLEILENNFLFGGGFGSFYSSEVIDTGTPHSDYLYFLSSGGVIGFSIFITLNFSLIYLTWRERLYPELFFFIAMSANGFTFNNLVRGRLSIIFWVVTLYAIAYIWSLRRQPVLR